ncbi:L-threonylcarbamoyladenylate synthase [uncultured Gulosibacter sp.]|uniref:L-threonylcarbamoyladenylate synthase n=1 Tax=uncultured Gulosibacter sp. TaxID=1339167 RepID=UPI00288C1E34|nr:L-threonylcarbamoyladenylate synthase [uncultured Gulosibacter sp.]
MSEVFDLSQPEQLLSGMREARMALGRGEVIVMPTDTVYGIAADAFNPDAVAALLAAKERTRQAPPPVLVASTAALQALAEQIPQQVAELFEEFAPGPLTVILPAQSSLQWDLGDTHGTVALRIPDHPLALELLRETGPLAVSSANKHGGPAPATAEAAAVQLSDAVNIFLDAGEVGGVASTIVDATGLCENPPQPARIVRQGALTRELLAERLGDLLAPEPDTDGSAVGAERQANTRSLPAFKPSEAASPAPEA